MTTIAELRDRADAILEGIDEPGMTVRWRIADRVLCCPDCREPMGEHGLDRVRGKGYVWRCPHQPVKSKGRKRQ